MNIEKAMEDLKIKHAWKADDPELEPCIFCGGQAELIARLPLYGLGGAWVECRTCHARGPMASICATIITPDKLCTPLLPESLERGVMTAAGAWNSRTADRSRSGNMKLEVSV